MLGWLDYRVRLAWLRIQRERVKRLYERDYAAARKRKASHDEINSIYSGEMTEVGWAEEEILKHESKYYVSASRDLFIPTDISDSDWITDLDTGGRALSLEALMRLRKQVRAEAAERRQQWLPMATAFAASIAAFTGLITAFYKK